MKIWYAAGLAATLLVGGCTGDEPGDPAKPSPTSPPPGFSYSADTVFWQP